MAEESYEKMELDELLLILKSKTHISPDEFRQKDPLAQIKILSDQGDLGEAIRKKLDLNREEVVQNLVEVIDGLDGDQPSHTQRHKKDGGNLPGSGDPLIRG